MKWKNCKYWDKEATDANQGSCDKIYQSLILGSPVDWLYTPADFGCIHFKQKEE